MTLFLSLILCVFTTFTATVVQAQSTSLSQTQMTLPRPSDSSPDDVTRSVFGQIRLENLQYFTPLNDAPNLTRSQFLSGRMSMTSLSANPWKFDYASDIIAGTFFSQRQTHWMVNELSMSTLINPKVRATLGRKKQEWSELDQYWQLSLWQPQYSIDALRPETQGLTGLFLDYDTENLQILGFYSPLFIPTVGPDIREEDGNLKSDSRWYRAPSATYNLGNSVNGISYHLDVPDRLKLANNWSDGLYTRVGSKSKGPWVVVAVADKPINDLVLKRNVVVGTNSQGAAVVEPDVARHYLWSMDVGFSFETAKLILSYLADRPKVARPEADWATQNLQPLSSYSAMLDLNLASWTSKPLQLQIGYLKIFGGEIQDIESDGQNADFTLFDSRLKFTNTFSAKLQGTFFRLFNRALNTKIFYFYDWDQRGTLVGSEFQFEYSKQWMILAGADILGVEDESYKPSSFLNQYRANDRVYGGLTYVF